MPRKATGNTELIQFRITKSQKLMLQEYAMSQQTTIGDVLRHQIGQLLAHVVSGREAA